uniref:Tetraspanin n=1 Tax=Meloidogyne floridensis TaxID=298350 RepID=A0A915P2B3_9BILA
MSSSYCSNFSQKILKLISLILLFIGILIASFISWLRFDEIFELKMRQILIFSDPSMAPPELIDTKLIFRQTYFALFWIFLIFGIILILAGLFGILSICTKNKPFNGLLCMLLILLIFVQIYTLLSGYLSTSLKYNLQDAVVIQERFSCCGDDDITATYNYRCIEFGQPSCNQLLSKYFNLIFLSIGIFLTILIFIELMAIIICVILLCKRGDQQ